MTGNIDVVAGSTDKYLAFWSAFNNVSNWRIGYQGSGHAESNYFVLQSSKDTTDTWTNALQFGNRTLDATFAGKIIAPQGLQGNADTASKFKTAQTITVAGDATGTVTFDGSEAKTLSLDVGSADQLSSNYKINGTAFNGSKDITTASWGTARNVSITDGTNTGTATSMGAATSGSYSLKLPTTIKATLTGNASTATSLAKAVTIALAGDVSGSASFNGAGDITINTEVADNSHNHIATNISDLKFAICGDNLLSRDKIISRGLTSFTYDTATQIYTCVAPIGSSNWGYGITFSNTGRRILIPRGKTVFFSLEIYPTAACTWVQDTNNQFASGTASSINDNDVNRSSNSKTLEANKWQKCWFSYTAPADRDLIDVNSNWGIITKDFTAKITFYLRNIQAQIGDIPTAFQTPTLSIATTSNTSSGTIYLLGVTGNTSGELQYNGNIYMNGSNGTITAKGFNGNATSASKLATARTISLTGSVTGSGSFDGSGNLSIATTTNHSHSYLPLSGGTLTGTLKFADNIGISGLMAGGSDGWTLCGTGVDDAGVLALTITDNASSDYFDIIFDDSGADPVTAIRFGGTRINSYVPLYGAVWNDYAEYRETKYEVKPGHAVSENGDDTLSQTYKRLQPACSIVSDTFGFAIGETEKCKTPLAMAGRVLAYPYEDRNSYKPGDAVCSGPNGTVSKMTCQEKVMYPECIVGYVSCVPTYKTWGEKDTKVDGRIWIKVV